MNYQKQSLKESGDIIHQFGSLFPVRLGLSAQVQSLSIQGLNRLLAHSIAIRDTYRKIHWQRSESPLCDPQSLFIKHHDQQLVIMKALANRVQVLGGVAFAPSQKSTNELSISVVPRGHEPDIVQLVRLLKAHEIVLTGARSIAKSLAESGDDDSYDVVVSVLIRTNEQQSWIVSQHLTIQTDI